MKTTRLSSRLRTFGNDLAGQFCVAEVLTVFSAPVASRDGVFYSARACGRKAADGLWHGWIEFTPVAGGQPICSPRETTQPNRVDAEYWATGLAPVYLEGALQRALAAPPSRAVLPKNPLASIKRAPSGQRESVMDPFSVHAKGEHVLRKQLAALSPWHLVNIVVTYDLTDEPVGSLERRSEEFLIELIVDAVKARSGSRYSDQGL